ncbi:MAG TPA: serine/threonine protein kinase [Vicinamibacteria bacterium]|nr:serine/threonine protein kinase [Vicinamibacteria bacterium]
MKDSSSEPIDETVVQDDAQRADSKDRSEAPLNPEAPGYAVERRLGSGSYGEVWLATHENTGRKVAIKFFSRYKGLDWPLLKREVEKLVEVLSERRVVHLLQVGWDADPPYYVMEYLPGGSLAERLAGSALSIREAVDVFREVAEALVYLHGKAILHCDLKPANVLLDDRNQIRLADFGQARLSSETGPALGTLFYMAPEQTEHGARPDVRSDIYSLGALVFTMLTGKPPYSTETASDELASSRSTRERIERYRRLIAESPAPSSHHHIEGADRTLVEIVDRCLKKDPEERFQNVPQVLEALDSRERQKTRKPLVVLGVLGPLALLVALAGVGVWARYQAASRATEALTAQTLASASGYVELIGAVVDQNLSAVQRRVERESEQPELRKLLSERASEVALQRYIEGLYDDYRERYFHNWVLADENAVVVARAPFDERVVGARYAYREWFTGVEDVDPERADPIARPRRTTGITLAFESTAAGNPILVSVSSPVLSEGGTIGVLAATLHLDTFNQWLADAEGPPNETGCPTRFAVLLNRGQLVRHPCPDEDSPRLPLARQAYFETPVVRRLMDAGRVEDYRDPLRPGRGFFAASLRLGSNADWAAIVQHDRTAALSPLTELVSEFTTLGRIAAGFGLLLVMTLWALLFRLTRTRF